MRSRESHREEEPPMAYGVVASPSAPTSGMGANFLTPGGAVAFRVWAPNASAVVLLLRSADADPWVLLNLHPDDATGNYWSADVSGVSVGDEYRFRMTNDPTKGPNNPGGVFEHVDPRARQVESADLASPGYVVSPAFTFAGFQPVAPQDLVIYQLHVGSFRGKNDTIQPAGGVAHFTDVIPKLSYITAMNFNAVQFLPNGAYPPDQPEGYAPTNFFSPEPTEGAPGDLRQLVDACHTAGLAVFFDVIYNHFPDDDNSLWQFDGNASNWNGGGIYVADAPPTPWGSRPATDRPPVHDFFLDNARMWLGEYDADGFRLDSLHNVYPLAGAQWLVGDIASAYPGKVRIAEHDNPPWAMGAFPLTACWDMSCADNYRDQVLAGASADALVSLINFNVPYAANYVRYLLGSHDQIFNAFNDGTWQCGYCRYFVERVGGVFVGRSDWTAQAKARLGWALNVTMPGTPMLFMGSEVHHYGYWSPDSDGYGDHRFDWSLTTDAIGSPMKQLVTDANALRRAHPALRTNALLFTHQDDDNGVVAFKRWNDQGDVILTVVNVGENQFSDATYGVSLGGDGGTWEEIFNSQSPQYGGWADSGNYLAFPSVQSDGKMYLRLPKLGVLVFRKT
jgi:1,4-alpha-glucan branching enzyme